MNESDIREEIDALLQKIDATLAEGSDPKQDNDEPAVQGTHESDQPPAEEKQAPTIITVYVFDTLPPYAARDERETDEFPCTGHHTVDSTLAPPLDDDEPLCEGDALAGTVSPACENTTTIPTPRWMRPRTAGLLLALVCVALLGVLIAALYVLPLLTATASITVMPVQTPITTTNTLIVVTTGSVVSHRQQVPGRLLSTLTLSGQHTVATTGQGHQDATFAHGTVTFYNAALFTQTIPAGTLLVGKDGVQVVTEHDAVLPAGSLATNGQATVFAHAVQMGPTGNIRAGDIYGSCCRVDVLVQNAGAFTGGQNARTYPMVTRADLDSTVTALTASLAQSVQAAFAAQVQPDETLLTPVPCVSHVSTDHRVGEEATQVTILLDETCTAETYETQAVQTQVTQAVTATALQHLGADYTLEGDVQTTVLQVTRTTGPRGGVLLRVKGTGVWAYRFTDASLHTLAMRIAGRSRAQATSLLLDAPGVSQVVMQVSGVTSTLPTDPSRIHLLVLYQP